MMNIEKADRARMLRRARKPALSSMEYSSLQNELCEISEVCCDIHYFYDDEKTLLDALDGDDEAEYEFRMAFSALDEKVNALNTALNEAQWAQPYDDDYDPEEDFNACLVALVGDFYHQGGDQIWGFDAGEGDYFNLFSEAGDWSAYAVSEACKRLQRKTKEQMLKSIQSTLRIFLAMIDIREEYDYLKAAFDILKDENGKLLRAIREIEAAYDRAERESDGFKWTHCKEVRELDRLVAELPARYWIE